MLKCPTDLGRLTIHCGRGVSSGLYKLSASELAEQIGEEPKTRSRRIRGKTDSQSECKWSRGGVLHKKHRSFHSWTTWSTSWRYTVRGWYGDVPKQVRIQLIQELMPVAMNATSLPRIYILEATALFELFDLAGLFWKSRQRLKHGLRSSTWFYKNFDIRISQKPSL